MKRILLTAILVVLLSVSQTQATDSNSLYSYSSSGSVKTDTNKSNPVIYQLEPAVDVLSLDFNKLNPDNPKVEKLEIMLPLHGKFSYSAPVRNSQADLWESRYKQNAFNCETSMQYKDLEKLKTGAVGSDDAIKTQTFEALKKGKYKIEIVHVHKSKMVYMTQITVKVK